MTHNDKARELVERLKVVARCGTDSTMRHSAYAFMAQDPDGDYVTYSAYAAQAEENRRLREAILREAAAICKRIRLRPDLSEDERVGVLECALALTDEANAARAALSSTGEKG